MQVKKVERKVGMKVIVVVGILALTSVFIFTDILKPNYITESNNARFNQWVKYYSKCDGYTVEYYSFDVFKSESDVVTRTREGEMAGDVQKFKQLTGFVTVYYDWENDVLFYSGSGPDSTLQYCYYSSF